MFESKNETFYLQVAPAVFFSLLSLVSNLVKPLLLQLYKDRGVSRAADKKREEYFHRIRYDKKLLFCNAIFRWKKNSPISHECFFLHFLYVSKTSTYVKFVNRAFTELSNKFAKSQLKEHFPASVIRWTKNCDTCGASLSTGELPMDGKLFIYLETANGTSKEKISTCCYKVKF